MTRIIMEVVEPCKMRLASYQEDGCGDWYTDPETGDLHIKIASDGDIQNNDTAFLIGLHEMIEQRLCAHRGIQQAAVDAFDEAFTGADQPGDAPDAPYVKEHREAMLIESMMAHFMGLLTHVRIE